jgi:tetratricopeptide (TPR) repeat protein
VEKALEIDHTLGEAHAALGLLHAYYDWNWELAESELQQALQLTPGSAMVHMSYSWLLSLTERHHDALIEARQAQELDPLSSVVNTHVGFAYIWGAQYDDAIRELQITLTMSPTFYLAHYYLGLAYRAKSMMEEAIKEFEKAVELGAGTTWPAMILAATHFESGKEVQGAELFENLKERSRHEYVPPMGFFYIHLARGEGDNALDCLEQACKQHDSFLPWCNVIPIECYRIPDEPRFRRLLDRAGLVGAKKP